MILFDHQKRFLQKNPNKTALVWSCGTGKTRAAIEWAMKGERETEREHKQPVLVICPKALKTNWQKEFIKYDCPFTPVILTKEEFRKEWENLSPFFQIIVDEVHVGFLTPQFKSLMSKALKGYLKKYASPRLLLLSATPYTSSPWNVYNLAFYLGHNWNYNYFKVDFFNDVRMGFRVIPVAKKGSEKKLAAMVKKIADVVDIHDVMDVPLQHHSDPEYFSLTTFQKKMIKENYDPLPIVRYTKEHEIEQGFVIDGNEDEIIFGADKIDRIVTLVEENPKIAIICRYNAQIDMLIDELHEHTPLVIRGDVENRHEVCERAERAERAVVLIQADCAEGYQLPSFPLCVFASQSYSYVKWEQMCGRFLRMDKPSRTTFMYLLTEGDSIDQAVYDAVKRKEDFKIELFTKRK